MSKYRTDYKKDLEGFWKEVLVNRKIVDVRFKDGAISEFVLDSGEAVYVHKNENGFATLMIMD